jgi:hypothetical protein
MIVQNAPAGEPHFVITMEQHTAFADAMARAFGNDRFEPVSPREEMLFVIGHHDAGWAPVDAEPGLDPKTGLPWSLRGTPREKLLQTSYGSPDFNEKHSPYAGLISSMHIYGLQTGRYGLMPTRAIDSLPPEARATTQKMMDDQLARQERLKAKVAQDPKTAPWLEEKHLLQNYKQLQFFDLVGLYFHQNHPKLRKVDTIPGVPMTRDCDTPVTITPVDERTYRFAPFPFAQDGMEIAFEGRWFTPVADAQGVDAKRAIYSLPVTRQTLRFVA